MAVEHLTDDTFDQAISQGVVLVDFFATWCGPCKMLGPVIEEIGAECDGSFKVCKADIDECPDAAMDFDVMSVPTLIIFKDGAPAEQLVGFRPKEAIIGAIESVK